MNVISRVMTTLQNAYQTAEVPTATILSVLLMSIALSAVEWLVYRLVSKRGFYNRSFHICIAVIPLFISTIILSLQSNIVITLGTIGALAIIRFRTAIKDPIDMVYILWSVHIGICCGCQLYELAVLTSLLVAVILFALESLRLGVMPRTLVLHCDGASLPEVERALRASAKRVRVKSRSYTADGVDLVADVTVKDAAAFAQALDALPSVERFSLLEYDEETIL